VVAVHWMLSRRPFSSWRTIPPSTRVIPAHDTCRKVEQYVWPAGGNNAACRVHHSLKGCSSQPLSKAACNRPRLTEWNEEAAPHACEKQHTPLVYIFTATAEPLHQWRMYAERTTCKFPCTLLKAAAEPALNVPTGFSILEGHPHATHGNSPARRVSVQVG
jgi:hypothetical protein